MIEQFSICRRCKTTLEATDTGFIAAYCSKCDPNTQEQQKPTITRRIIGDATLYLGDCYEVFQDYSPDFDALVTDPPYDFETSGGGRFRRNRTVMDQIAENGLDNGFDVESLPLQIGKSAVFFCHNDQLPDLLLVLRQRYERFAVCSWHKSNPMPVANKHYRPDTEFYVHAWRKGGHPVGDLRDLGRYVIAPVGKSIYNHPTSKPLPLMEKIIRNVQGDTILDPFMGSGTTGIAALKYGRKFIGIEKNPVFFEEAVKRFIEFDRQKCLF